MFICPNCSFKLETTHKNWYCSNNHNFDVSKQGSVNLLLPQQKRSLSPGDSKEMVVARHNFLQTGIYAPIAKKLTQYSQTLTQSLPSLVIADAGCGEGYYLREIQKAISNKKSIQHIGWDISKHAVQIAAKSNKKQLNSNITWLTASNANIPLFNNSVNLLMSNFGFNVIEEFSRILKKKGYLITTEVGENHLIEIRELIYPSIKTYKKKPPLSSNHFKQIKKESLTYQITLNQQQINQLLLMTPHFFRTTSKNKESLSNIENIHITIHIIFICYIAIN